MVKITPGVVIGAVATTAAVGLVGYAAWFDYERRHNPEFRKKLLKEQHRQRKVAEVSSRRAQASQQDALRSGIRAMKQEKVPETAEERESYFLEQVAIGEALAARGQAFYVPAAISFFKGLQVYPQPQELLMIYQRTQPAEVVALLMEALRLSITDEGSSSGGGSIAAARRSQQSGTAILEEIETDSKEASAPGSSAQTSSSAADSPADRDASSSSANGSQNGEEASNNSSPSTRSYVNVDYPQVA